MLNVFDESAAALRSKVQEQQNRITSELNANIDGTNAALVKFNDDMKAVQHRRNEAAKLEGQAVTKRAEADQMAAAAIRAFDSAISNGNSVQIAIVQQLEAGQMITGSDVPSTRRPKLVAGGEP